MNVLFLDPPGRFPTVVSDLGPLWLAAETSGIGAGRFSANYHWWRAVCSTDSQSCMLTGSPAERLRQRLEWQSAGISLKRTAVDAGRALDQFHHADTFTSLDLYQKSCAAFAMHLESLNQAQDDIDFTLHSGPWVRSVNYDSSAELVDYAHRETFLSRLVSHALAYCPDNIDMVVLLTTSPQDLLCAMIVANQLRVRSPRMHICLGDHGYEDFSLHPYIAELRRTGALEKIFDSIITHKDERRSVLKELIAQIQRGEQPRGFLSGGPQVSVGFANQNDVPAQISPLRPVVAPPVPTFAPYPILWTRVSERRCYWSRCAFCTQNSKYTDPNPPSKAELAAVYIRLEALLSAGYRTFIFSDEAIAPGFLEAFCKGIQERELSFSWSCRARLERSFDESLFALMKEVGCYEILFGLESTSPSVLARMRKHEHGLDLEHVKDLFRATDRIELGLHVTMITGFPGETVQEASETVRFVIGALEGHRRATFKLNRFAAFPDTAVTRNPHEFGLRLRLPGGDMPFSYGYETDDRSDDTVAVDALHAELEEQLYEALGWRSGSDANPYRKTLLHLYFHSGHGTVMKSGLCNVLGCGL